MPPTPEILKALGPLAELYADPEIIEIMVDAPGQVLVERRMSGMEQADVRFASPEALRQTIDELVAACGAEHLPGETVLEMRFPEGQARALAVLPPTALHGPHLVIRKLLFPQITWEMLLEFGAVTQEVYDLFYQAVRVPANILVSGGTGSGKTTLLNRIAELIPPEERVIVAEWRPRDPGHAPARPCTWKRGELSMDDVLSTASKMRPDWLVVGELLGGEAMRATMHQQRAFCPHQPARQQRARRPLSPGRHVPDG
jgi:pilus assembly protein CpaF